jgi:hypothetical protein
MGNRKRGYKPNSRTRQKRAAAIREWEAENLEDEEAGDAGIRGSGSAAPRSSGTGEGGQRPLLQRLFSVERRPATRAERDATPWSRRGLATMALIAAVLAIPLGTVGYFSDGKKDPYGAYVVGVINPAAVIPLYLGLLMLLAMPLARALAKEPRSLRVLETLGFAAVVQIFLIFLWTLVFRDNAWYQHGEAIAGGAAADIGALAAGVLFYPKISTWLLRRKPRD